MRNVCAPGMILLLLGTAGVRAEGPDRRNPPGARGHWTILFYGAGADEKHLLKTVGVMKDHFVDGRGVELIALIDRPGKYADGHRLHLHGHRAGALRRGVGRGGAGAAA